jgi:hypothetical protein
MIVPSFTAVDDGPHAPPPTLIGWLETWDLGWYDPATRIGGTFGLRLDADTDTARAHLGLWIDGVAVHRRGTAAASAAPTGPGRAARPGVRVGELELATVEPLRSLALTADEVELDYTAAGEPFRFTMSGQRVDLGEEHYDSFGTVTGTVRVQGRAVQVVAPAFHRHAWGTGRPGVAPLRSAHGVFGEDLYFSITEYRTAAGAVVPLGYLFADEEFHGVEKARFQLEQAPDGTPLGCDLLIATADRRDFRIPGRVEASGTSPDAMSVARSGLAVFELASRRGGGVLTVHEDRPAAPAATGTNGQHR